MLCTRILVSHACALSKTWGVAWPRPMSTSTYPSPDRSFCGGAEDSVARPASKFTASPESPALLASPAWPNERDPGLATSTRSTNFARSEANHSARGRGVSSSRKCASPTRKSWVAPVEKVHHSGDEVIMAKMAGEPSSCWEYETWLAWAAGVGEPGGKERQTPSR